MKHFIIRVFLCLGFVASLPAVPCAVIPGPEDDSHAIVADNRAQVNPQENERIPRSPDTMDIAQQWTFRSASNNRPQSGNTQGDKFSSHHSLDPFGVIKKLDDLQAYQGAKLLSQYRREDTKEELQKPTTSHEPHTEPAPKSELYPPHTLPKNSTRLRKLSLLAKILQGKPELLRYLHSKYKHHVGNPHTKSSAYTNPNHVHLPVQTPYQRYPDKSRVAPRNAFSFFEEDVTTSTRANEPLVQSVDDLKLLVRWDWMNSFVPNTIPEKVLPAALPLDQSLQNVDPVTKLILDSTPLLRFRSYSEMDNQSPQVVSSNSYQTQSEIQPLRIVQQGTQTTSHGHRHSGHHGNKHGHHQGSHANRPQNHANQKQSNLNQSHHSHHKLHPASGHQQHQRHPGSHQHQQKVHPKTHSQGQAVNRVLVQANPGAGHQQYSPPIHHQHHQGHRVVTRPSAFHQQGSTFTVSNGPGISHGVQTQNYNPGTSGAKHVNAKQVHHGETQGIARLTPGTHTHGAFASQTQYQNPSLTAVGVNSYSANHTLHDSTINLLTALLHDNDAAEEILKLINDIPTHEFGNNLDPSYDDQVYEYNVELLKNGLDRRLHPQPGASPYPNSATLDKSPSAVPLYIQSQTQVSKPKENPSYAPENSQTSPQNLVIIVDERTIPKTTGYGADGYNTSKSFPEVVKSVSEYPQKHEQLKITPQSPLPIPLYIQPTKSHSNSPTPTQGSPYNDYENNDDYSQEYIIQEEIKTGQYSSTYPPAEYEYDNKLSPYRPLTNSEQGGPGEETYLGGLSPGNIYTQPLRNNYSAYSEQLLQNGNNQEIVSEASQTSRKYETGSANDPAYTSGNSNDNYQSQKSSPGSQYNSDTNAVSTFSDSSNIENYPEDKFQVESYETTTNQPYVSEVNTYNNENEVKENTQESGHGDESKVAKVVIIIKENNEATTLQQDNSENSLDVVQNPYEDPYSTTSSYPETTTPAPSYNDESTPSYTETTQSEYYPDSSYPAANNPDNYTTDKVTYTDEAATYSQDQNSPLNYNEGVLDIIEDNASETSVDISYSGAQDSENYDTNNQDYTYSSTETNDPVASNYDDSGNQRYIPSAEQYLTESETETNDYEEKYETPYTSTTRRPEEPYEPIDEVIDNQTYPENESSPTEDIYEEPRVINQPVYDTEPESGNYNGEQELSNFERDLSEDNVRNFETSPGSTRLQFPSGYKKLPIPNGRYYKPGPYPPRRYLGIGRRDPMRRLPPMPLPQKYYRVSESGNFGEYSSRAASRSDSGNYDNTKSSYKPRSKFPVDGQYVSKKPLPLNQLIPPRVLQSVVSKFTGNPLVP